MTPEERVLRRLAAEIATELERLSALRAEAASAPRDGGSFAVRARRSILHDFYSGIERAFRRIAEELDGGAPQGDQWHRQLLADMSLEIRGVRPPVITADLGKRLGEYLRFRHVVRNVYGYDLDEERLAPLEERLPETLDACDDQLRAFSRWLEGVD